MVSDRMGAPKCGVTGRVEASGDGSERIPPRQTEQRREKLIEHAARELRVGQHSGDCQEAVAGAYLEREGEQGGGIRNFSFLGTVPGCVHWSGASG